MWGCVGGLSQELGLTHSFPSPFSTLPSTTAESRCKDVDLYTGKCAVLSMISATAARRPGQADLIVDIIAKVGRREKVVRCLR